MTNRQLLCASCDEAADRFHFEILEPRLLFSAAPTPAQLITANNNPNLFYNPALISTPTPTPQSIQIGTLSQPTITPAPAPQPPPSAAALAVAESNNAFAFDLLNELDQTNQGNLFFSPYSAATALEMTLQGADGATAAEMIKALHLPSADLAQAGIQALYQLFQGDPSATGSTLSTANRLWVNDNFALLDSFLTASQNTFGADPQPVDFSDPQAAANTINAWVAAQTHGKIPSLIDPGDINSFTRLILTNAIYFKGSWANAFNPSATTTSPFQIDSTLAATVQMMHQTSDFNYYQQSGPNGFQALDLPYDGNNLDMMVILPTTYDLNTFAQTLTPSVFDEISSGMSENDVQLSFPQFELNETYDLTAPLKDLGINTAFSDGADFSGISATPLQISDVIQKSFIQVDETGTEAAAATAVIMGAQILCESAEPPPIPITFNADHPFIFAIRDKATNTILFLGSVSDPSNGAADFSTPPASISGVTPPAPPDQISQFIPITYTLQIPPPIVSAPAPVQPPATPPVPASPSQPVTPPRQIVAPNPIAAQSIAFATSSTDLINSFSIATDDGNLLA